MSLLTVTGNAADTIAKSAQEVADLRQILSLDADAEAIAFVAAELGKMQKRFETLTRELETERRRA